MTGKIDRLKRLRLLGDFLMMGTFLLLLWIFISAYMSGSFRTNVNINNYGEAHVEMIVLVFFLLPLFGITVALSFLDWRQTWKAKKKILEQKLVLAAPSRSYPQTLEGTLRCPGCGMNFYASNLYNGAITTCPSCGMVGRYIPSQKDFESADEGPTVRVIKDIWQ